MTRAEREEKLYTFRVPDACLCFKSHRKSLLIPLASAA